MSDNDGGRFVYVLAPLLIASGVFLVLGNEEQVSAPAPARDPTLKPVVVVAPNPPAAVVAPDPAPPQRVQPRRAQVVRAAEKKKVVPADIFVHPEPEPAPAPVEKSEEAEVLAFEEPVIAPALPVQAKFEIPPEPLPQMPPERRAPVTISFRENLEWFKTTAIEVSIDGKLAVAKRSDVGLDKESKIELHAGEHLIGRHTMTVRVKLVGNSETFSYMDGYVFNLKQNSVLQLDTRETQVTITAIDNKDITREWHQRLSLKVDIAPAQGAAM